MKLSVIIVNYNVQHFLEQCLYAVRKASQGLAVEVFVVDNNSVDGSVAMVQQKFTEVQCIANKSNTGFSYANNQAIRLAKGEYVLLLNPDTVVEEDTFKKVIAFMDAHPDAGGLGVKMLDGKGKFLPESKRGLPTPSVAFYKIVGLSALFPKSKLFGNYHLGYLNKDQTHQVDILSGAFMLLRKEVLDKIGLLDETFFMYGEDIDLSYRILLAGYKNYYYPDTRIIHYKGESTKKSSINYVFVFYKAMVIFAEKHFSQNNAKLFSFLIHLAIYLRAGIAIAMRFVKKMALPTVDFAFIVAGMYLLTNYYEKNVRFIAGGSYSDALISVAFTAYSLIWLFTIYLSGGYDKPLRLIKILRGIIVGTGIILIVYSLLPEAYRFSRALILLGMAWAAIYFALSRLLLPLIGFSSLALFSATHKRIAIIGTEAEYARVKSLLTAMNVPIDLLKFVSINENANIAQADYIGHSNQIQDIIHIHKIEEVIFCSRDVSSQNIIDYMHTLVSADVDFKIAPPESLSVIGSNSIDTAGDLYIIDVNSISKPKNKRNKRLLDISTSIFLLALMPLIIWIQKNPLGYIRNCLSVIFGLKTWVGYGKASNNSQLPSIKKSVFSPADALPVVENNVDVLNRLNLAYSKDYKVENDLRIIAKMVRKLGAA